MYKQGINPGDKFTIYNTSIFPVTHPVTGKECGYIHFFKGILEIKKAEKGYHIAQISESFQSQFPPVYSPFHAREVLQLIL
jgi:hypothetical protein